MRTGDAIAASFFGSLLMAWRRQLPEACPREQRPHTAGRAVKAIGENPPDPVGGLLLNRCPLELLIRLRKGCRASVLGIAQVPEHAATDNGGEIHLRGETTAVLFIRQDIDRQRQPTSREYRHHTLLPQGTDQAVERHGGDVIQHRAQF